MPIKPPTKEQPFDDSFWSDPAEWPHDYPGHVFLARAFEEMGRATFGEGWFRLGVEVPEPEMPDDNCSEAVWDEYDLADDRYEQAHDRALAERQQRRIRIARMIAENCKIGTIVTAGRAKPGGEMIKLESHFWYTENYLVRFFRCDMSLDHPFTVRGTAPQTHWIYVSRSSLEPFLANRTLMPASDLKQGGTEEINAPMDAQPAARRLPGQLLATIEAIKELWGESGPRHGLMAKRRDLEVNKWLEKHDRSTVSPATIRRALVKLRPTRANADRN